MNNHRQYVSLTIQQSISELIAESRRGYLGILWWIIEPIMYMSVFYLVFVVIFQRRGDDQVLFLLTGLVVWKMFAASIPQCAMSIQSNAGLVRQMYIPKLLFPIMAVIKNAIKFFIILSLLIAFIALMGKEVNAAWVALPLLIAIQLLLIVAAGMVLAAVVPFFPDFKMLIDNGMMLLFFLSGIIFDISNAPEKVKFYLSFNPVLIVVEGYRDILLSGVWPNVYHMSLISVFSLAVLVMGIYMMRKYDRVYAKILS
jgi:lipopolysaccharide transport system permease protein